MPQIHGVKRRYPTSKQKCRLIQLLKNDPELRSGRFSATLTMQVAASRWNRIAEELNAIPGAKKTGMGWRKTWTDLKSNSKKKFAPKKMKKSSSDEDDEPILDSLTERWSRTQHSDPLLNEDDTVVNDQTLMKEVKTEDLITPTEYLRPEPVQEFVANMEVRRKRSGYPSAEQRRRLMELLEADPELGSGRFSATFTFKAAQARWCKIAHELNSLEGAQKTWFEWRKTYQDKKTKSKKKTSAKIKSAKRNAAGPRSKVVFLNSVVDSSTTNSVHGIKTRLSDYDEMVSPTPSLHETERILQDMEQSRLRMEQQMLETNQQMVVVMNRFADAAESLSNAGSRLTNVLESVGHALIAYLNRQQ